MTVEGTKPISPYIRLQRIAMEWASAVAYPHRTIMWRYPKDKLRDGSWSLADLNELVRAADQLGYDVRLKADDDGLAVYYVKRPPDIPSAFRR